MSLQPLRPSAGNALHYLHRPFHFVAFGLTALLLWRFFSVAAWPLIFSGVLAARSGVGAVLATIVLGGTLELLQHLIYHNRMEWWDVRDDGSAAIAATLVASVARTALAVPLSLRKSTPARGARTPIEGHLRER